LQFQDGSPCRRERGVGHPVPQPQEKSEPLAHCMGYRLAYQPDSPIMPIDPQNALLTVQGGLAQLSMLIVSYSFSAIGAIILLVVGYVVAGLAERSIFAGLGHINGFDATLRHFFSKIVRYAILILVVIMVLGQFGVQTASIIAAIGAIGLAIGLALQGTLQNIAAGIMLLALRPFRIGEYAEVGAISGPSRK
jgi:small conductance mechanosensitive channel